MWKRREACSKVVLIGRGLDQVILVLGRRFHCSILRARGKSAAGTPLRVPAEGWAAKRHQSGHMGLASPMNGRRRSRSGRSPGRPYAPLAQLVEQLTLNQRVPGSSP